MNGRDLDACLGLILRNVSKIVEDEQIERVVRFDCPFEKKVAPCLFELLNGIRGSGVEIGVQ